MKTRFLCAALVSGLLTSGMMTPVWSQDQTIAEKNDQNTVQIKEASVCQEVVDRQPVGKSDWKLLTLRILFFILLMTSKAY